MGILMRRAVLGSGGSVFAFNITSDQLNANLRSLAVAAGWDTTSPVAATLKAGVKCHSTSSGGVGLTVNGSFPGGVSLLVEATGMIYGGYGYAGDSTGSVSNPGGPGGTALNVSVPITITNNGTIAGGGGGGGAGGCGSGGSGFFAGGNGGTGAYGAVGATAGYPAPFPPNSNAAGGNGGALGTAGVAGQNDYFNGGAGGAAGKSVNGNSNITWLNTGTRTGPIT